MTPEETLAKHVHDVCGPWIDEAVAGTPYPASLLGALSANESGGDPAKSRFEPAIFGKLARVIVGHDAAHEAHFGSIGAQDLKAWCDPVVPIVGGEHVETVVTTRRPFDQSLLALVNLATSWGPTQIMGYEALAGNFDLSDLVDLKKHYPHAVRMLADFEKRFNLPPSLSPRPAAPLGGPGPDIGDWSSYFHCWNAGSPNAPTADPNYTANGLARMKLYEQVT